MALRSESMFQDCRGRPTLANVVNSHPGERREMDRAISSFLMGRYWNPTDGREKTASLASAIF
jgi:hypothetical protein